MIDTIALRLGAVKVSPQAKLTIEGGKTDYSTGEIKQSLLFTDTSGGQAWGRKAYINEELFNLDIAEAYGGLGYFLHFSAPRQINENNYSPISEEQFAEAIDKVEAGLAEKGIETDIREASITRLDCFKNTLPDEPIECYSRVFGLLNANYAKDKTTYGVTGWLMKNTRQQFCIYDKLAEMEKSKVDIRGLNKTLRFEHRVIKSDKVKTFYGFENVKQLQKNYKRIASKQRETWEKDFFKYSPEEVEIKAESQLRMELQYFQAKFGNRFFSHYLKVMGAKTLQQQAGSFEVIRKALQNLECNRMRIWRAEKELNEAMFEIEALKPEPITFRTLGSLYIELKEKVLCEG